MEEMTRFCGKNSESFKYGWGVTHKKKNRLICNIFAVATAAGFGTL